MTADSFITSAGLLIVASVLYGAMLLGLSFREPRGFGRLRPAAEGDPSAAPILVVFMLPCLNEGKVIGASIERLLSLPYDDFVIMVVDDGSEDETAAIVATHDDPRVRLMRRILPMARQGKGEALNAATQYLLGSEHLVGRDPERVIVAVVDADGRLESHALAEVLPLFDDPSLGAVQIGVRINNRYSSRLARMQDMEFVIYTDVFQRGRRHLGSVGLGGNGQFMRLSALTTLGTNPWSPSLTEDLDLGIRLIAAGWRTEFCSRAAVHQQGVVHLGRLIRQRTRWFQGHLQSWSLIPTVLREVPDHGRADLLYHLTSPALLLMASLLTCAFFLGLLSTVLGMAAGAASWSLWPLTAYGLSFGPAMAYSVVYWRRERVNGMTRLQSAGWSHLYVAYGLMWYAAGWWAVWRTLRGQSGWAKTARNTETAATTKGPDSATQRTAAQGTEQPA